MRPAQEHPVRRLIAAITQWRARVPPPLVVAIDGHGSAGKSTLAEQLVAACDAHRTAPAVIHTDDFMLSAAHAAASIGSYYDWRRLRREALEPLRAGRAASFRAFDWEADALRAGLVTVAASELIVVEGVFSSALALADLVDRAVLVLTPEPERLARTRLRVPPALWDERWLEAERTYFATRPPAAFDLVLSGGGG